ncbi:MAG: phenylalanine--tRNA ligase subunit beta [Anaerolineae bacterium]|nr:phenylalanine--tRNA ligase subunit beta [Anaerolineales bacterium]MCQ3975535.1 phenylalanine--tRNA ligase subunit beta [Anaerolineae bacterium]
MKVPVSWLKDFVDITLSVEELAERLTLAGLEVGSIRYIGVEGADLVWERDKLVLGHILKVEQHPQADRLVLATVDIGAAQPETVVTGAPNLFEFVGQGHISRLGLKSPFVMEGATVYDGHAKEPGVKMKLKGREIRGIMNRHMLCSEKELGLSDEHEGIILTTEAAPPGTPLVDLWGDAVLDIDITPNMSRCASILGVAREVVALTGQKLRYPDTTLPPPSEREQGESLVIETTEPDLNPRFVAILIKGITIKDSPYWMQRRLRLAGMRPISNIVDISNYVMLEMGQPNHAFDWDALRRRAQKYNSPPVGGTEGGQGPVKIITRLAQPGETVLTLDGKTHEMPNFSILVTDPQGNLSIGGIMGGGETEVSEHSQNILLEAAAWNFINIRRTSQALNIKSEAAYRFSRGVHPSQAMVGALRGAKLMVELAGGKIAGDVLDYYPNPPQPVTVELPQEEVTRLLGVELSLAEIKNILESLEFKVEEIEADSSPHASRLTPHALRVTVPDHRLDISTDPIIGQADLIEEIARIYGYDRLPVSEMADELPPQRNNESLDREERIRDLLVQAGLQEVITYRLTTPEAEARILESVDRRSYVTLANPSTPERAAMRQSLLNSVLEIAAENTKHHQRVQMFEVGHIYLPPKTDMKEEIDEPAVLPEEQRRLAVVMTGAREEQSWLGADTAPVDFFDLKGVVESILAGLHVDNVVFSPTRQPAYYPGRVAELSVNGQSVGVLGQLHPHVAQSYDFKTNSDWPVLAADFDLDRLLAQVPAGHVVKSVPRFPPVQQDIAVIVDEAIPAEQVQALISQTGRPLLTEVRLFDLFRGEQIGAGKKSLAYSLTFQAEDRTLTDQDAAKQQQKITQRLERELGARLRG